MTDCALMLVMNSFMSLTALELRHTPHFGWCLYVLDSWKYSLIEREQLWPHELLKEQHKAVHVKKLVVRDIYRHRQAFVLVLY